MGRFVLGLSEFNSGMGNFCKAWVNLTLLMCGQVSDELHCGVGKLLFGVGRFLQGMGYFNQGVGKLNLGLGNISAGSG